jgi:hypothetical protein
LRSRAPAIAIVPVVLSMSGQCGSGHRNGKERYCNLSI